MCSYATANMATDVSPSAAPSQLKKLIETGHASTVNNIQLTVELALVNSVATMPSARQQERLKTLPLLQWHTCYFLNVLDALPGLPSEAACFLSLPWIKPPRRSCTTSRIIRFGANFPALSHENPHHSASLSPFGVRGNRLEPGTS